MATIRNGSKFGLMTNLGLFIARGLFAQRPFEPIAWIMLGMGIAHGIAFAAYLT